MLDNYQRVTDIKQLGKGTHQFGDVVKVQPCGGFVKQEQCAFAGQWLFAFGCGLCGLRQKACQFQALRLAAAKRWHGLAEFDVVQPHIHNGLQGA